MATTGSTDTTSLQNLTIQNFLQEGVRVANAGVLCGSQADGTGTIECRGNSVGGLAIAQTSGVSLPLNAVTGFL